MDINEAYENLGYKKVFASLDGSDLQYDVLARAIVIASNNHAELYVGHVIDATVFEGTGISIGSVVPKLEQAFRDQIAPLIDDAAANPRDAQGEDDRRDRARRHRLRCARALEHQVRAFGIHLDVSAAQLHL